MLAGLVLAVSLRAAHELVGAGVLPMLVRDLGGESWAGAFFAVYGLAAAVGIVGGGRATDAWGPTRPLAVGLAAFAAGMTATGLAASMRGVVAARALEGLGGGIVSVVVSAAVIRGYAPAARPRVLAWLSAAWVVPGLVAPALAVGVAARLGWRVVFLGLAPLVALAAALVLPSLRGWPRVTAPGAATTTGGRRRIPADAAGWAGTASAGLGPALAVRALVVFAFFGVESFLPLALSAVRDARASQLAAILTLSALAWTAGAFVHSRACVRWPAPVLARGGALALLVGIACAAASLFEGTPIAVALAGWTLAGLGMGVAYDAATASAMHATRSGAEGATGTALGIVDALAASLATSAGGALVAAAPLVHGSPPTLLVAAFVLAGGAGAASAGPAGRLRGADASRGAQRTAA